MPCPDHFAAQITLAGIGHLRAAARGPLPLLSHFLSTVLVRTDRMITRSKSLSIVLLCTLPKNVKSHLNLFLLTS